MYGDVLEPFLTFFVAARPFEEVSRLTVVSKTWREGDGQYRASVQSDRFSLTTLSCVSQEDLKRLTHTGFRG